MAKVTLKNLSKDFGSVKVLRNIDLEINDNEFVVFVGPSGCGKSTLLRLIAGLEDAGSGDILIDDQTVTDLPPSKRGIAMVFQSYALYPHMTAYENMAFGLKISKNSQQDIDEKVKKAASILQLEHLLDRKPKELSGGQRQRVAIGRAIVRNPSVFLFDEPLSNLDATLRIQMRMEIAKLKETLQTTMIYVTHDQTEAMTLADKIVVLRQGIVEQVGSPLHLYHHPRNIFVAGFIGSPSMNFVKSQITSLSDKHIEVNFADMGDIQVPLVCPKNGWDAKPKDIVTVGIRPEHFILCEEKGRFKGKIILIERLGSETYIYVDIKAPNPLLIRVQGGRDFKIKQTVYFDIHQAQCHIFDKNELSFERLPLKEK
jgi:multiple sugar transport system ATP-binding protein